MKRNNYFAQVQDLRPVIVVPDKDFVPETIKSEENGVFDMIYSRDPETGQHQNALGVFLSKDTSPMVRQYIKDNLLCSQKDVANPVIDGISDEDMVTLTRDRNEPQCDYVQRVRDYMYKQRKAVQDRLKEEKRKVESKKD